MTRPNYEGDKDLKAEYEIAAELTRAWAWRFEKLRKEDRWDFLAYENDRPAAFVEIKNRKNPSTQYPTLILSAKKYMWGLAYMRLNVCAIIVVRWTDGIYWMKIDQGAAPDIRYGGRSDRGDPKDIELLVHLPVDWFHRLVGQ